jgi:hypothetical protein
MFWLKISKQLLRFLTVYLVHIFHFENAHYINLNRTFKAKTRKEISLPRTLVYLFPTL